MRSESRLLVSDLTTSACTHKSEKSSGDWVCTRVRDAGQKLGHCPELHTLEAVQTVLIATNTTTSTCITFHIELYCLPNKAVMHPLHSWFQHLLRWCIYISIRMYVCMYVGDYYVCTYIRISSGYAYVVVQDYHFSWLNMSASSLMPDMLNMYLCMY